MKFDFHLPYLGKLNEVALNLASRRGLRVSEAVVAPIAHEPRVSWLFSCFNSPEECLHSKVKPNSNVLKDLSVHRLQRGAILLHWDNRGSLIVESQGFALLLIGFLALFKQLIVDKATLLKAFFQKSFLSRCRVQSVLELPKHNPLYYLEPRLSIAKHGDSHTRLKPVALSPKSR